MHEYLCIKKQTFSFSRSEKEIGYRDVEITEGMQTSNEFEFVGSRDDHNSCWEEGRTMTFLCAPRMQRSDSGSATLSCMGWETLSISGVIFCLPPAAHG